MKEKKMKKIFLVLFTVLSSGLFAQGAGQGSADSKDFVYTPRRYNAIAATGDSLISGVLAIATTADTTRPIVLAGWNQVHLILSQATGTAGTLNVKYQGSTDGVNFGTNLITVDSLTWSAATAKKSFDLTSKCGGFYAVRLVITGTASGTTYTGVNTYSASVRKKK